MYHSFAALDITACPEEQIISCNQIDSEDADNENQDESVVAMIEEPNSGIIIHKLHSRFPLLSPYFLENFYDPSNYDPSDFLLFS